MKRRYNWNEVREKIEVMGLASYKEISEQLGIPVSTLRDNVTPAKTQTKVHKMSDGNIEVNVESEFPKTPEDLAEAAGIDLNEYNVKAFDCFAREVYVKDIDKDLEFDAGRITGHVSDHGEMKIRQVWSSRLLVEPVKVKPRSLTLTPISIMIEPSGPVEPSRPQTELTALVLPDIHFGHGPKGVFHSAPALDAVLDLVVERNFTDIILLGDVLDMTEFTDRFILDPEHIRSTQLAFEDAANFLGMLREAAPDTRISYLEGNHEQRLANSIRKHLISLAGLHAVGERQEVASIPYFLGLADIAVDYYQGYPDNYFKWYGATAIHGDVISQRPGMTASKIIEKYNRSIIFGHIHRSEHVETTTWSDIENGYKRIFAYSPGCLCRIDGAVPGSSPSMGWRQGVGILHKSGDGMFVQDVPFNGRRLLL